MKHVTVRTDSAVGRYMRAKVPWLDVWIRFHRGRQTERLAPCLCGYLDLLAELDVSEHVAKEYPDDTNYLEVYRFALRSVEVNGYAVDNSTSIEMPEIFSREKFIDRAEANRLLALWLRDSMGLKGPFKFHWKPPKHFVGAITVNTPRVQAFAKGEKR